MSFYQALQYLCVQCGVVGFMVINQDRAEVCSSESHCLEQLFLFMCGATYHGHYDAQRELLCKGRFLCGSWMEFLSSGDPPQSAIQPRVGPVY